MSAAAAAALVGKSLSSHDVSAHEALSGVFGAISLATWMFVLIPQLILNYKTGSADGLSLAFLTVWLIGDITNLSGALWAQLVPTVILLAIYFCISDFILITQCLYYNHINAAREKRHRSVVSTTSEDEPLLARARSHDTTGLPGSHRRRSSNRRPSNVSEIRQDTLSKILEEPAASTGDWVYNTTVILGICVVGAVGWAIAWKSGAWKPTPEGGVTPDSEMAFGAQILGYVSAVCYLGARIPQIFKNYKDKSCEGLSLLFFMLSLMGNASYGAGILSHSLEREYLITNMPWLIGSLGTMLEDGVIFFQFRIYKPQAEAATSAIQS